MSHFQQHYSQLQDDTLLELALTRELTREAGEALNAELLKRGYTDLLMKKVALQAEIQVEMQVEELHRQKMIAIQQKFIGWFAKSLYFLAIAMCAYGIYRLVVPNVDRPGDDGGLMLVGGIAIFLFAVVLSRLLTFFFKNIVYRRRPR